jgi:hypothetical protein
MKREPAVGSSPCAQAREHMTKTSGGVAESINSTSFDPAAGVAAGSTLHPSVAVLAGMSAPLQPQTSAHNILAGRSGTLLCCYGRCLIAMSTMEPVSFPQREHVTHFGTETRSHVHIMTYVMYCEASELAKWSRTAGQCPGGFFAQITMHPLNIHLSD